MINGYYIFDDIISKSDQIKLEEYVKLPNLKWNYQDNITGEYGGTDFLKLPANVLTSIDIMDTNILNIINSIKLNLLNKLNMEFEKDYRYKINWTTPINKNYDFKNLIHVDMDVAHIAIVYYINDTDGNTSFLNNKKGNSAESHQSNFKGIDVDAFEIINKIPPKKGRAIIFDGNIYHYGEYPTITDRFIINFDLVGKSKNKNKNNLI
jgi:hypothetical protein